MNNSRKGWILLIVCFVCSFIAMNAAVVYGSLFNAEAGDLHGIIGAIIGFMIPPIVYFGNKLG